MVTEHMAPENQTFKGGGSVVEHWRAEEAAVPGHPGKLVGFVACQTPEMLGKGMVAGVEEVDGERVSPRGYPLGVIEHREADQKARRVNAALSGEGDEAAASLRPVVRRHDVHGRIEQPRHSGEGHAAYLPADGPDIALQNVIREPRQAP